MHGHTDFLKMCTQLKLLQEFRGGGECIWSSAHQVLGETIPKWGGVATMEASQDTLRMKKTKVWVFSESWSPAGSRTWGSWDFQLYAPTPFTIMQLDYIPRETWTTLQCSQSLSSWTHNNVSISLEDAEAGKREASKGTTAKEVRFTTSNFVVFQEQHILYCI